MCYNTILVIDWKRKKMMKEGDRHMGGFYFINSNFLYIFYL